MTTKSLFTMAGILLIGFGPGAYRANCAGIEAGQAEATGFGGVVSGVGTHGTVGGSLGVAAVPRLLILGEVAYVPGGSVEGQGVFSGTGSSRIYAFNGGAHYLFGGSSKSVPYAGAGLGLVRATASIDGRALGLNISQKFSDTSLYFNFGGGLRYYVSDSWGVRPEFMIFAGNQTFVRLAIGIFYQFGK
jgi:opacity protein-like surface antigen